MKIEIAKEISLEIIKFANQISNNSANKGKDELFKYKKENIKAIIVYNQDNIAACCFVRTIYFRDLEINWLFNLYSPNNSGYGGLIIKFAINKYNNLCCIGVTDEASKIYKILKWKQINTYFRYIKIINYKKFINIYKYRLSFYKKLILLFYYILSSTILKIIYFNKVANYDYFITKNILRFYNNSEKINFNIFRPIYNNKKLIFAEFLSQKKQNFLHYFLNGFIKIKSPIYYFSKNNQINERFILENINCFKNTDKIF